MKNIYFILSIILFFIQPVTGYIYVNIYLEESGTTEFLGETNEILNLPLGVKLEEGLIRGTTQELTSKQGSIWTFSYSLQDSDLNIILPNEATIIELSNGEISIENNQISIYAQNSINIKYSINPLPKEKSFPYGLTITILLIIFILIYFFKNKQKMIIDKLSIIKQTLSPRESLILDKLKENGKVKSSLLRRLTLLPKASFARHIQQLEKKNLIKRSGEGRNKFIELLNK